MIVVYSYTYVYIIEITDLVICLDTWIFFYKHIYYNCISLSHVI